MFCSKEFCISWYYIFALRRLARNLLLIFPATVMLFFLLLLPGTPTSAQTPVFINEIHYDNTGADVGEAIEIAGPAGADLTGWSVVLYNGNGGAVYDTDVLSGTIPNLCGGFGVVVVNYSANGIQNGAPDGIALVNDANTVVQFLSYEGSFAATNGPANGMTSEDIGVLEAGNEAVGQSLQLGGSGTAYENFNWSSPATHTFGACNTGQIFSQGEVGPFVSGTSPTNGETGVAIDANIMIDFSEAVTVNGNWFSIAGSTSGAHAATVSSGPQNFTIDPDDDFATGENVTVTIFAAQIADADSDDPPDNLSADFSFSFTIVAGVSGWIINEILADPDGALGDANGDRTVNTSDDEFVEIANVSGAQADISGWTLSDGVSVRHTFPAGTVVSDQCVIIIFGGSAPIGAFGGATVQTASAGQLGLNNTGDTVTLNNGAIVVTAYTYGAEGGDNQSLTRDPDLSIAGPLVKHTTAIGSGGALFSSGKKVDGSSFSGCRTETPLKEIFEIQGASLISPFANQMITTASNVVTAVSADGFFMQTPAVRADGDVQTSDGVFVFIGALPFVHPGDLVNVTGEVVEFFGQTEFSSGSTVTIVSSGNPLPPAVQLDAFTPSPQQPQSTTEFERLEGMSVEIAEGMVAESNQFFRSDTIAELRVVAGTNRPFREPGIPFPGLPSLPVWDGNPEIFELDPDRLGQPNVTIPAGSTFSASGVMGYEFGGYEFWPTSYSFNSATLPLAVRVRAADEATIGTLNLHRFFDDDDDPNLSEPLPTPEEYHGKLNKLSKYIREVLLAPDILAVQEAENLNVLSDLANKIKSDDGRLAYTPYLVEGNDVGGIDVGFLIHNSITVDTIAQLGDAETFTFDGSLLHDRPPLLLRATLPNGEPISIMNLHLRSLSGIDDPVDGTRVRQKRHEQATSVSLLVQNQQAGNSDANLVVIGDFNAFQFTDGYVHVLGQITGAPADATQALIPGTDNVNPNLINETLSLPPVELYSFDFQGSAQAIDHVLVSQVLEPLVSGIAYGRGNADAATIYESDGSTALRASDHDGLVLYVKLSLTSIENDEDEIVSNVSDYALAGNYPNPFNSNTMITFTMPTVGNVSLQIFTETGQHVNTLVDGKLAAGRHALSWNANNYSGMPVASGTYFYQLIIEKQNGKLALNETRRMTLVK